MEEIDPALQAEWEKKLTEIEEGDKEGVKPEEGPLGPAGNNWIN